MKLDPPDTANVKGRRRAMLSSLNTMWSGGSLAQRDAEHRRRKEDAGSYLLEESGEDVFQAEPDEEDPEEEAMTWYHHAKDDEVILANFREARPLKQARTARYCVTLSGPQSEPSERDRSGTKVPARTTSAQSEGKKDGGRGGREGRGGKGGNGQFGNSLTEILVRKEHN